MRSGILIFSVVAAYLILTSACFAAPPVLGVSPTYLEFSAYKGGANPDPQILSIWRDGGNGPLNWTVTEGCSWLIVEPNSGKSLGEVDDCNVIVDITGLITGTYNCQLTVDAGTAANSPQIVDVNLFVFVEGELHVPLLYPTIQAAINDANYGDIVIVADGIYTGTGNRDIDFLGKAITVRSKNGPTNCIIDCNGTESNPHRGFYFDSNEGPSSILDGFTITNGYDPNYGGGIYCNGSSPTVTNCIVTGNTAGMAGGGIHCESGSNLSIINCNISSNLAQGGSAVSSGGGICLLDSSAIISNCTISDNSAIGSPHPSGPAEGGGGIFCVGGISTVINCTIIGNTTRKFGGGIFCASDSYITVTNCIVWNNTSILGLGDEIGLTGRSYPEWGGEPYIPSTCSISYSNVGGGQAEVYVAYPDCNLNWGPGNIDADPCFVTGPLGDYYLSQTAAGQAFDSPCVDAGSDTAAILRMDASYTTRTDEVVDIDIVDMGYHYPGPNPADIDYDGNVDFLDYAILAAKWLQEGPGASPADIAPIGSGDNIVDFADLDVLVYYWLWGFPTVPVPVGSGDL